MEASKNCFFFFWVAHTKTAGPPPHPAAGLGALPGGGGGGGRNVSAATEDLTPEINRPLLSVTIRATSSFSRCGAPEGRVVGCCCWNVLQHLALTRQHVAGTLPAFAEQMNGSWETTGDGILLYSQIHP